MKQLITFSVTLLLLLPFGHADSNCAESKVKYGSDTFMVHSLFYTAASESSRNLIVIPPTGGTNWFDRDYAKTFCRSGFNVYILDRWTGDDEYTYELEVHDRLYTRSQRAIELTLAQMKSSRFVGVFGTSVGAIHAAIAMGKFADIDAAFTIVGGAPLSSVIAESDQKVLAEVRRKRMESFNFRTTREYAAALEQAISLQPHKLPRLFEGKKLGMVLSSNDSTVPSGTQDALKALWNPQVTYSFAKDHVSTIFFAWLTKKRDITKFFLETSKSNDL